MAKDISNTVENQELAEVLKSEYGMEITPYLGDVNRGDMEYSQ